MNESVYDLALLGASVLVIALSGILLAFTSIEPEFATAMLGGGVGVLGARSGRAMVDKS